MSSFQTLSQLWPRDPLGVATAVLASLAIAQGAIALGRSRQWYMVPFTCCVTALLGFLLNPLADASTLHDLRAALTSYDTLTLLCIVQFVLVAISAWLGLGLETSARQDRRALWLAVVSVVPAPALAIAILLWEQQTLASVADARPESVGREAGLIVAVVLGLACLAAMCLPRRLLAVLHPFLSLGLLMACMFLPFLQDPLPQSLVAVDWDSLRLFAVLLPLWIVFVAAGFWWPWMRESSSSCLSLTTTRQTAAGRGALATQPAAAIARPTAPDYRTAN